MTFKLLGIAEELRQGTPLESHGAPAALVASERARLSELLEQTPVTTDAEERSGTEQKMPMRLGAEMGRLDRYEAACPRRAEEARRRLLPRVPAPAPVVYPLPQPPPPRSEPPAPPLRYDGPSPILNVWAVPPSPDSAPVPVPPRLNRRAQRAAVRPARAGRS